MGHPPDNTDLQRIVKATKLLEGLTKEYPDASDYRYDLIEAYATLDIRNPLVTRELYPMAEQCLQQALSLSDKLVAEHPSVPTYAVSRVHVLHKLADVQLVAGEFGVAEKSLQSALSSQESLAQRFPEDPTHQIWLALVHRSLGRFHMEQGSPEEARGHLQQSVAILVPLIESEAELPLVRRVLAEVRRGLADAIRHAGGGGEAGAIPGPSPSR
jgi:tetratricopeptide (TPR) repeat protein